MSPVSPRTLRPRNTTFSPRQIAGLSLWLDGSDSSSLYQTEEGPRTAVSSPLEITGCVGWWDASDYGSITQSGGAISQWRDKSGTGNHASQGTAGSQPTLVSNALNGLSVVRFDGGDALLGTLSSSISTNAYSVFAVVKLSGSVNNGRVFSTAGAGNDFASGSVIPCLANGNSATQLGAYNGATGANVAAVSGFGSYAIFSGVCGSSSVTNFSNGSSASAAAVTLTTAITRFGLGAPAMGTTGGIQGDIAEIIFYPTALSAADRARVEAYLGSKWSISTPAASKATANNDPVGYWGDKSGNARHVTQATSANRPVLTTNAMNGRQALTFDGTNDALWATSLTPLPTSPLTVMLCMDSLVSSAAQDKGVMALSSSSVSNSYDNNGGLNFIANSAGRSGTRRAFEWYDRAASGGLEMETTDAATAQPVGRKIYSVVASGATGKFFQDGNEVDSQSGTVSTSTTRLSLGGIIASNSPSLFFNGRISEALIYSRDISVGERQRCEGYLAWKWGLQQQLPWNHPYAVAFPGYGSQTVVTDSDARAYLTAVAAADGGTGVEVCVARAIDDFVIQSKAAGIWSAIKASCILCGARTLAGALVPLAGTAPTNNNFVSADYNRKTGLVGGTGKYLSANRSNAADGQNDQHMSAYLSAIVSNGSTLQPMIGYGSSVITGSSYVAYRTSDSLAAYESRTSAAWTSSAAVTAASLVGISRASSANFQTRFTNTTTTITAASSTPTNGDIYVLTRNNGGSIVNGLISRLAFYSIGSSLDLATLDTRVSALYQGINYALNTGLSPLGYDTDTLAYLNAGYAAGGTLA